MSTAETEQIVLKGVERLKMTVTKEALAEIVRLSQGLPYVTHMLSLYSARAALDDKLLTVSASAVQAGIQKALDLWQASIKTAYYGATRSHQPDHLYKEVLLACALADVDDKSFFTAAAVRAAQGGRRTARLGHPKLFAPPQRNERGAPGMHTSP